MGLLAGLTHFLGALGMLLTSPSLMIRALIPSAIALGLSILVMGYGLEHSDLLTAWLVESVDQESILYTVLSWSSYLLIGLLAFAISPLLMILFGIPLCEPLAGRAHDLLGGTEQDLPFLESVISGVMLGLKVVLITLLGNITLFFIGLIPPLGLVTAPFALFVWTPFWLCFDLCDAVHSRSHLSFSERSSILRQNLLETISVGLVAAFLVSPPYLNLIGLPIAVLMGTRHAHTIEIRRLKQGS